MSQSPLSDRDPNRKGYEEAWTAIQNMIHEGRSWSGREKNCAFLNTSEERFADCSAVSGLNFSDDGRAAAVVDWDLDGDCDLWLANRTGPRLRFLRNETGSSNGFVAFRLEGRECNRDAIGARLELHTSGGRRIQTLRAGEGFVAQSSSWVHFGLGDSRRINRLVVRWPGGKAETYRNLLPNRRYRVTQGSGQAAEWSAPLRQVELSPSSPVAPPERDAARVVLAARPPLPPLEYQDFAGQRHPLAPKRNRPLLINLWASWCSPCVSELKGFSAHRKEIQRRGLSIVALSVDSPEKHPEALALVNKLGLGFPTGVAPPKLIEILETMQRVLIPRRRPLALPTSFLVDTRHRLAVIYKGSLPTEQLLADLALLPLEGKPLRDAAVPFSGIWYTEPGRVKLDRLAYEFLVFGSTNVAKHFLQNALRLNPQNASAHMNLGAIYSRDGLDSQAIPHYRAAIQAGPPSIRAHMNLATALRRTGQQPRAIEVFRRVIELDAGNAVAHCGVALVLIKMKRWKEALRSIEESLKTMPGRLDLLHLQSRLLAACPELSLRDGKRAQQLALQVLTQRRSLEDLQTLPMALAELKEFGRAVEIQKQVLVLAEKKGVARMIQELKQDLALYEKGQTARAPWPDDHPFLSPPPL
ncbi:MAG: tetratricopeptide repeat protein, partial [Planctomycetota bacterium]